MRHSVIFAQVAVDDTLKRGQVFKKFDLKSCEFFMFQKKIPENFNWELFVNKLMMSPNSHLFGLIAMLTKSSQLSLCFWPKINCFDDQIHAGQQLTLQSGQVYMNSTWKVGLYIYKQLLYILIGFMSDCSPMVWRHQFYSWRIKLLHRQHRFSEREKERYQPMFAYTYYIQQNHIVV